MRVGKGFFKLDHDSDLYIFFRDIGLRWLKSCEQVFVKYRGCCSIYFCKYSDLAKVTLVPTSDRGPKGDENGSKTKTELN